MSHTMKMPTTRRGRYLYFRARMQRRLALIRKRHFRRPAGLLQIGHKGYDLSGFGFQAPKSYPRVVGADPTQTGPFGGEVLPANEERPFPVAKSPPGTDAEIVTQLKHRQAIGYHKRRVLRVPRVKHVPRRP